MQNFAIGALGQLNEGFAEQHKQQAYEDAQNAEMVRNVSVNAINRYNAAEGKASEDLMKHQQLVKTWGPTYAAALEGGASVSDLQYLNQTGNVQDTYADDMDQKRWQMYQDTLKTVQSNPTNRKIKGNMDWGQVFQPPKPFGTKGFQGATPVQQAQIAQLHGQPQQSQGDQITPAPMPGVQSAPLDGSQPTQGNPVTASQPSANGDITMPLGPNFQFTKRDTTPNNQNMVTLNKAIQKTAAETVNTYFKTGTVQTGADGSTNYHFDDVQANQFTQNLQIFGNEITAKLAQDRVSKGLRPQDVDPGDVQNAMMGATRMLIEDLRAHGYTEDIGVKVLGSMTPQEFSKAVWDARDDAAQRTQAQKQGVGPTQVGSYLDIKNHPNDPNVGVVQKHYDTVVQLVQQYHSDPTTTSNYPIGVNDDTDKDATKFNQRYGNNLQDKAGKPTKFKPKLDKTPITKEQAQSMVNALPLADYMKLVQYIEEQINAQAQAGRTGDLNQELQGEQPAQPGEGGNMDLPNIGNNTPDGVVNTKTPEGQ